jgi:hypothetical protein
MPNISDVSRPSGFKFKPSNRLDVLAVHGNPADTLPTIGTFKSRWIDRGAALRGGERRPQVRSQGRVRHSTHAGNELMGPLSIGRCGVGRLKNHQIDAKAGAHPNCSCCRIRGSCGPCTPERQLFHSEVRDLPWFVRLIETCYQFWRGVVILSVSSKTAQNSGREVQTVKASATRSAETIGHSRRTQSCRCCEPVKLRSAWDVLISAF